MPRRLHREGASGRRGVAVFLPGLAVAGLFFACVPSARAQTPLTLPQAVEIALEKNPVRKAALAEERAAAAADSEARARALEARLMAPCCYAQTVDLHESDAARQVRAELRQWLGEGLSDQQILKRFAERYGARILAVPPAQGFNRWLYWLPILLSAAATAGVVWLLWLWRRRSRGAPAV